MRNIIVSFSVYSQLKLSPCLGVVILRNNRFLNFLNTFKEIVIIL